MFVFSEKKFIYTMSGRQMNMLKKPILYGETQEIIKFDIVE